MCSGAYRGVQLREQEEQQRHNHPHHQVVPPTWGRVSPTHPTTQQDQARLRGELRDQQDHGSLMMLLGPGMSQRCVSGGN
jgi:hypothetical protein